jgi:hypothetical protein
MIDLPAPLPAGEEVLWEGAPRTWSFLRQVAHPRILAAYVALLVLSCVYTGAHGGDLHGALVASGKFTGLSVVAFVLLAGIARLQVGSTDYIITNRRVMITFGAALGKTLQIPFTSIEAAALRAHGDGTGDLVLTLVPSQKVNFFLLWPNVRPWRFNPAEPMLRSIPDAQGAAQVLARALAVQAATAPVVIADEVSDVRGGAMAAAA